MAQTRRVMPLLLFFANSDRTCSSFIGWNVRTAANNLIKSPAVNSVTTTDVGRFHSVWTLNGRYRI